jgi:hypothetical protein
VQARTLVETFVELADTLVDEFDVAALTRPGRLVAVRAGCRASGAVDSGERGRALTGHIGQIAS